MKTVLLLHGFPRRITEDHILYLQFKKLGFRVVCPDLFAMDCRYCIEDLLPAIEHALGNLKPDVIAGVSAGGLIAPHIAAFFPKAKLILIATAAKYRPETILLKTLKPLLGNSLFLSLLLLARIIPDPVLFLLYRLFNPYYGDESDMKEYMVDMKVNISTIKRIPKEKIREVISLVLTIDNGRLLGTLTNRSLIIAGTKDVLMPVSQAEHMHSLIRGSRLSFYERNHFELINYTGLPAITEFIHADSHNKNNKGKLNPYLNEPAKR